MAGGVPGVPPTLTGDNVGGPSQDAGVLRVVACLVALVVAPVLAGDEAPGAPVAPLDAEAQLDAWTLELPLDYAPTLPDGDTPLQVALWLPQDELREEGVPHADALRPGSSRRALSSRHCLLELTAPPLKGFAALALRWGAATLSLSDGRVLQPQARALTVGWDLTAPVSATLFFPPLPDPTCELALRVPGAGDDDPALELRLFRWRERLERAEAALATWRAEVLTQAAEGAGISGQAVQDLLACGERVAVPLLLRELARGPEEDPLPAAVVLPVLAATAWGRADGVSPSPTDAPLVVARWAARGEPLAPGIRPPGR